MIISFYYSLGHLPQSCTLTENLHLAAATGSHFISLVPASSPGPGLVITQQSSESNVGTCLRTVCF